MTERDAERSVTRALEELGTVEPPAGLVVDVMTRISREAGTRFAGRVVPFDRGGRVMIKKAIWGLAAAAAVLLAVFTVIGFPIADRGTEATIGAAQKYQGGQLAASDVKVGDASVQEFLQSEAFDRLLKDPQARSILSDLRIQAQLINRDFTKALDDAQIRNQLSSELLYRFFEDNAAVAALNRNLANGLAIDVALARLTDDVALSVSTRGVLTQMRSQTELMRLLNVNAVRVALSSDLFREFTRDAAAMAALNSDVFVRAVQQQGFVNAVQTGAVGRALSVNLSR
jgi:hypothetical protein